MPTMNSFSTEEEEGASKSSQSASSRNVGSNTLENYDFNYMTPERYSNQTVIQSKKKLQGHFPLVSIAPSRNRSDIVPAKKKLISPWKSVKNRNKRRTLPTHPLSLHSTYRNEDTTCDADIDESSDSTYQKLRTTTTTAGTSKTSSMSSSGTRSSRSQNVIEKHIHHHGNNSVTAFLTPPRGFIRSSPLLEFSPLSLSNDSSCSSSIESENSTSKNSLLKSTCDEEAKVVDEQSMKKKPIPTTLYFRSFHRRSNRQYATAEMTSNRFNKKSKCITRIKRTSFHPYRNKFRCAISTKLTIKCIVCICIYCVITFLSASIRINQLEFEGKVKVIDEFKSLHIGKGNLRRDFAHATTNNNISVFQDSNQRIAFKRTLGGFYAVFTPNNNDSETFQTKTRRRFQQGNKSVGVTSVTDLKRSDHPRIFSFSSMDKFPKNRVVREMVMYPTIFSDNTQLYGIRDSGDPALANMEPIVDDENSECVPMQEWQKMHHPSCNSFHELNMSIDKVELVGKNGFSRDAWKVGLNDETVILKTPKYEHNFEQSYYEHDRVDAQAMDRLTFSPFVINVYGFCGRAVMSEFANGPRKLGTVIDKARKTPLRRLEIARDIARGLSHVHFGRDDANATLVHFDINPSNIVIVDKKFKLNDFNIAVMLKENMTSGSTCGFPPRFPNPQWRSPEEANGSTNLNEKVDVFSLGHLFFRIVGGHEPWNKLELSGKPSSTTLREKVKAGILPRIPDYAMNTKNAEEQVIRDAMLACYTFDPKERPTSRDIAEFLDYHLLQLTNGGEYKVRSGGNELYK